MIGDVATGGLVLILALLALGSTYVLGVKQGARQTTDLLRPHLREGAVEELELEHEADRR